MVTVTQQLKGLSAKTVEMQRLDKIERCNRCNVRHYAKDMYRIQVDLHHDEMLLVKTRYRCKPCMDGNV